MNSTASNFSIQTPSPGMSAWFATSISLAALGSIGYAILITVALARPNGIKGCGMLLSHLFIMDGIYCLLLFPLTAVFTYFGWRATAFLDCKHLYNIFSTVLHVAYWTKAVLALNRFVALFFPASYPKWAVKKAMFAMITATWAVSLSINMPKYLGIDNRVVYSPEMKDCVIVQAGVVPAGVIQITLGTYLPLAVTGILYSIIFVKVYFFSLNHVGIIRSNIRSRMAARRLVIAKMLFLSFFWHCLTVIPSPLVKYSFPHALVSHQEIGFWLRTCLLSGFAANPVIFICMNADYRNTLKRFFCPRNDVGDVHTMQRNFIT